MKLCDVVRAIVMEENISDKDIENTVLYLTQDNVLDDLRVFRRIVKKLNADMEYEEAPMS
jgi:hypothetical protein